MAFTNVLKQPNHAKIRQKKHTLKKAIAKGEHLNSLSWYYQR